MSETKKKLAIIVHSGTLDRLFCVFFTKNHYFRPLRYLAKILENNLGWCAGFAVQ